MAGNKVELELGTESALAKLEAVRQRVAQLRAELEGLKDVLGSMPGGGGGLGFGGGGATTTAQGRVRTSPSAAQSGAGTATPAGPTGPTMASRMADANRVQWSDVLSQGHTGTDALSIAAIMGGFAGSARPGMSAATPAPNVGAGMAVAIIRSAITSAAYGGPPAIAGGGGGGYWTWGSGGGSGGFAGGGGGGALPPGIAGLLPPGPGGGGSGAFAMPPLTPSYVPPPMQIPWGQMARMGAYALGYPALTAVNQGFDISTRLTLQGGVGGGSHAMETASAAGQWIGGMLGGAAGALTGNPWMTLGGAAIAGGAGASIGRWLAAPYAKDMDTIQNMMAFTGTVPMADRRLSGIGQLSRFSHILGTAPNGPFRGTEADIANMWAGMSESLSLGGINPYGRGVQTYASSDEDLQRAFAGNQGGGGGVARGAAGIAGFMIRNAGSGRETIAEMYVRRIQAVVGSKEAGTGYVKAVAPIFASLPDTAGNVADILDRFGAPDTVRYLRIHDDSLRPAVSRDELEARSGAIRGARRSERIASLQIRGSGTAQEAAYRTEMSEIAKLPEGSSSEAYARARRGAVESEYQKFGQEDIVQFGLRDTALRGARDVLSAMPFSPGNRFLLASGIISNDRMQLGRLTSRLQGLRARGELSEDMEMQITQQQWGLRRDIAQEVGQLADPMLNRMLPMSVGVPASFGRFNSVQLAAANIQQMGLPIRSFGAMGGRQARGADEWMRNMFGDLETPTSRTQGLNNPSGGSSSAIEDLLRQIRDELKGSANTNAFDGMPRNNNLPPQGGTTPWGNNSAFN